LVIGPPGCGKTLYAKAVAKETETTFISVKGPELKNMWYGKTEESIRFIFATAREAGKAVIFFDEVDAIAPRRGLSHSSADDSVIKQLLTELDGIEENRNLFTILATNRPDLLDPAIIRSRRCDKKYYVGPPDCDAIKEILRINLGLTGKERHKKMAPSKIGEDIEINSLANLLTQKGYTGADIAALINIAKQNMLRRLISLLNQGKDCNNEALTLKDIESALREIKPGYTERDEEYWERMAQELKLKDFKKIFG
jgi:transitional endoplasmic reticulum ATPase